METAFLLIKVLNAALAAGVNLTVFLGKVDVLLKEKHAKGETVTLDELIAQMDEGDQVQADVKAKVEAALAGAAPPTPPG